MKRALAIAAASGLLAFGVAPAAHAGEITGGKELKPTPVKTGHPVKEDSPVAASFCAFSGQDDVDEYEGEIPPGETEVQPDDFGRTQSFGQIAREAKGQLGGFNASFGCNPNSGFEE